MEFVVMFELVRTEYRSLGSPVPSCTCSGMAILSPLISVRTLLSSITEFMLSIHKVSTGPSNTIHFSSGFSSELSSRRESRGRAVRHTHRTTHLRCTSSFIYLFSYMYRHTHLQTCFAMFDSINFTVWFCFFPAHTGSQAFVVSALSDHLSFFFPFIWPCVSHLLSPQQ